MKKENKYFHKKTILKPEKVKGHIYILEYNQLVYLVWFIKCLFFGSVSRLQGQLIGLIKKLCG